MGDQFAWIGPVTGSWDVATNWEDMTAGQNPADVAPGSDDSVTINAAGGGAVHVITGTGDSASLTIDGSTVLAGQFTTGTLTVPDSGVELQLNAGDTLTVTGNASFQSNLLAIAGGTLNLQGGALTVDGNLAFGFDVYPNVNSITGGTLTAGSLTTDDSGTSISGGANVLITGNVTDSGAGSSYQVSDSTFTVDGTFTSSNNLIGATSGSYVQLAGLAFGTSGISLSADSTSSIEIGTAGDAAAGSITIDPGVTVTEAGTFTAPSIIDNGTLDLVANNKLTLSGVLSGSGQLNFGSNAVLTLSAVSNVSAPTIGGFNASDAIDYNGTVTSASYNNGVLTLYDNTTPVANLTLSGDYTGDTFYTLALPPNGFFPPQNETQIGIACYCRGTLILTERGEIPVENLLIGDKVITLLGVARPIKWIGRRSYGGRFLMGRADILPICIKSAALDENVPRRDLWISPRHAMYLEGVLIEAKDLINSVSIVRAERVEKVEYFHIELESHDVIFAEGALSETYIDDDSRFMFHNAQEYRALYPDAVAAPVQYCAPRQEDGFEVEAARRRTALRAGLVSDAGDSSIGALRGSVDCAGDRRIAGWAQSVDRPEVPVCLDIYADGRLIGQTLANRYREDLERAGLGSGWHGFAFRPLAGLIFNPATVEVRRSLDGSKLTHCAADNSSMVVRKSKAA